VSEKTILAVQFHSIGYLEGETTILQQLAKIENWILVNMNHVSTHAGEAIHYERLLRGFYSKMLMRMAVVVPHASAWFLSFSNFLSSLAERGEKAHQSKGRLKSERCLGTPTAVGTGRNQ
jgi:hypothetical protein